MFSNINDEKKCLAEVQQLKADFSRFFDEDKDRGDRIMKFLEFACSYHMPIFEPEEEGARRLVITIKNILRLDPEQLLQLLKGN